MLVICYQEIRKAVEVLMDTTPRGYEFDALLAELNATPGIEHVHHVHVWRPDEERIALEAHIALSGRDFDEATRIKEDLKERLRPKFQIDHATVEIERVSTVHHERELIQKE